MQFSTRHCIRVAKMTRKTTPGQAHYIPGAAASGFHFLDFFRVYAAMRPASLMRRT